MPVWDVARVAPRDQFGFWREVICEAFVPLAPKADRPATGFASRVEVRPIGGLNTAVIASRAQHTAHGPAEVRRTSGAYYFVNLQLAGTCLVRQHGRQEEVPAGRFCVLDTTEPYYLDFPTDWRMVSFRVPRGRLSTRLPTRALAAPVDGRSGPGRVVAGLMHTLWQLGGEPDGAAGFAGEHWEQSFAAAVAGALGGPGRDVAGGDLRDQVERYVRANLEAADLSVAAVARRFGLSPRSLHKLFSPADESFAAMVRRARLRRCADLLADASCTWTVAEVGARHGFADPASFSRAFRREFGTPPGEVRRGRSVR